MLLPGGHKSCTLLQVQKAHNRSELLDCAQIRVAIETHSLTSGAKCCMFREPGAKREVTWTVLCHACQKSGRFDILGLSERLPCTVVVQPAAVGLQ